MNPSQRNLLRVSDARFERCCQAFAGAVGGIEARHHGLTALGLGAMMSWSTIIFITAAVLRRREDRGRKIRHVQFAPPGKISSQEISMQFQAFHETLFLALHELVHDQDSIDTVFVLRDVPEFVGAYRDDADFGVLPTMRGCLTEKRIAGKNRRTLSHEHTIFPPIGGPKSLPPLDPPIGF
jgi:hypothetical protein